MLKTSISSLIKQNLLLVISLVIVIIGYLVKEYGNDAILSYYRIIVFIVGAWVVFLFCSKFNSTGNISGVTKELISLVTIIVIIYVMYLLWFSLGKQFIIIEPFEVPTSLIEKGYTGKAVASRLMNRIDYISSNSSFKLKNIPITSGSISSSDLIIPGSTTPLRSLVASFRDTINQPIPTITGDIVNTKDGLRMLVRLTGKKVIESVIYSEIKGEMTDIDHMIDDQAEHVILQLYPVALGSYYHNMDRHNDVIELYENIPIDKGYKGFPYLVWADALYRIGRFDEALKIIGKAPHPRNHKLVNGDAYRIWGFALRKKGHYDEAIIKLKTSLQYDPESSNTYSTLGNIFMLQHKYNEAAPMLRKALELDPGNPFAQHDLKQLPFAKVE